MARFSFNQIVVPVKKNWEQFGEFAGIDVGLLVAGLGIGLMQTGAILLAVFTCVFERRDR